MGDRSSQQGRASAAIDPQGCEYTAGHHYIDDVRASLLAVDPLLRGQGSVSLSLVSGPMANPGSDRSAPSTPHRKPRSRKQLGRRRAEIVQEVVLASLSMDSIWPHAQTTLSNLCPAHQSADYALCTLVPGDRNAARAQATSARAVVSLPEEGSLIGAADSSTYLNEYDSICVG
jgi:hypothetical protein